MAGICIMGGRTREVAGRNADARLIELADHGKATDARLGALIDLFERHLREDQPPRPS